MSISKQAIIDAYWFRHACKEFDATKTISTDDFEFILETARLSPSSFGLEPWKFLVVQNPALRKKMLPMVWGGQKQLPTASHVIISLIRKTCFMRYDSEYVQHFMRQVQKFPEDAATARTAILKKFQEQDFTLLDSERAIVDWGGKQTYIALGNMMTAAAMIGIDSCPIEGFEKAKLESLLAEEMSVDLEAWSVSYLVAFGYRKAEPARPKTRQTRDAVVEWFE
jgi:nitroreductase